MASGKLPALDRRDAAALASFVVYGLVVWWPTRELPYYWDAAANVIDATRELMRTGWHPLVPPHPFFTHAPLFHVLLGAVWRIFGETRAASHLLCLPWLPLAMTGTYAIGVRLGGRLEGLAAAFVFGTMPLAVTEVGQVYVDLPMAALSTCGVAAWLHGRRALASALFCLAVMTKIPAILVPAALGASVLVMPARRREWRDYAALGAPLACVLAYGAYHAHAVGYWFVAPAEAEHYGARSLGDLVHYVTILFPDVFAAQGRIVLVVAAAIAAAYILFVRRERFHSDALVCAWLPLAPALFFAAGSEFLTRYALFLLAPFVAASIHAVRRAAPRATWFGAFSALLVVLFASRWHPRTEPSGSFEISPPEDLSYLDHIAAARRAGAFLEARYPDADLLGGFHERYMFGEAHMGYVSRAFRVSSCQDRLPPSNRPIFAVVHPYAPEQRFCDFRPTEPPVNFVENGKFVQLRKLSP